MTRYVWFAHFLSVVILSLPPCVLLRYQFIVLTSQKASSGQTCKFAVKAYFVIVKATLYFITEEGKILATNNIIVTSRLDVAYARIKFTYRKHFE